MSAQTRSIVFSVLVVILVAGMTSLIVVNADIFIKGSTYYGTK
jgi:hypothetical protein